MGINRGCKNLHCISRTTLWVPRQLWWCHRSIFFVKIANLLLKPGKMRYEDVHHLRSSAMSGTEQGIKAEITLLLLYSLHCCTSSLHALGRWDFEWPWNGHHRLISCGLSTQLKQSQTAEKLNWLFKAQSLPILIWSKNYSWFWDQFRIVWPRTALETTKPVFPQKK